MSNARGGWKIWGLSSVLGAFACSGNLLDVGDLNGTAGHAATIQAGALGSSEGGNGSGISGPLAGGGAFGSRSGAAGTSAPTEPSATGSNTDAGAAGGSAQPDADDLNCPDCTMLSGPDVRDIASNEQKVFWVEYGTVDAAGHHRGDGRLLARDLDGGQISVLATSLAGPEWLAVSSSYVYVFIDRRELVNILMGVVRIPLNGGAAELIQELPNASTPGTQVFASTPEYEYWNWNGAVYRVAQTGGTAVETFSTRQSRSLFVDDTQLYLDGYPGSDGVWAVPLAGGDETQLSMKTVRVIQLAGDYLYGIESPPHGTTGGSVYLSRMPKAGGDWTHVIKAQTDWSQLDFAGDEYFMDQPGSAVVDGRSVGSLQLLRGSLSSPDSPPVLVASETDPPRNDLRIPSLPSGRWNCWQLTRVGIFFADYYGLYLTPALP